MCFWTLLPTLELYTELYSTTYLCYNTKSRKPYLLKKIKRFEQWPREKGDTGCVEEHILEAARFMSYTHSNSNKIVRTLEGTAKGIQCIYQVSHATSCGNLRELLDIKQILTEAEARPLF